MAHGSDADIEGLSDVLIDCVEGGASVSFMLPLPRARALAFWREAAASAARGERVLLAAEDARGNIVGTVQLLLQLPENQPHRAELAKMLVRRSARRQGVGAALLLAAEQQALAGGRTLLVLDTAIDDGASWLYERMGFTLSGVIPDYALKPHGGLTGTMIYWKRIGAVASA